MTKAKVEQKGKGLLSCLKKNQYVPFNCDNNNKEDLWKTVKALQEEVHCMRTFDLDLTRKVLLKLAPDSLKRNYNITDETTLTDLYNYFDNNSHNNDESETVIRDDDIEEPTLSAQLRSTASIAGKENKVAEDQEPLYGSDRHDIPQDMFSVMLIEREDNDLTPLLIAILVFALQMTIYIMMMINCINKDTSDTLFNIPVNIDVETRSTGFIAIIFTAIFQEDFRTALKMAFDGYDGCKFIIQGSRGHKSVATKRNWIISVMTRGVQGFFGLASTFLLIVQSDRVIELLLNFAALEFVSMLDNQTFSLSKQGFLGKSAQKAAEKICKSYYLQKAENPRNNIGVTRSSIFFSVTLVPMLLLWFSISLSQINGLISPCRSIFVQFDDNVIPRLDALSGTYKYERGFSYNLVSDNSIGTAQFEYCDSDRFWAFAYNSDSSDELDPCKTWKLRSAKTDDAFDIGAASLLEWFALIDDRREISIGNMRLECFNMENKAICGGNGNINRKTASCDCDQGWYGLKCGFRTPCQVLEIDPRSNNFFGNRQFGNKFDRLEYTSEGSKMETKYVNIHNRPVYIHQTSASEFDVILFMGRRWCLTATSTWDDLQKGTHYTLTKQRLIEYIDNKFSTFWSDYKVYFISDPVDVDTPTDLLPTPAGLNWYSEEPSSFESKTVLLCSVCHNETNPCQAGGFCQQNGVCDCLQNGASGSLCQIFPIKDGYCDPYFNTGLFQFDGGDCCQATCVSSTHNCGRDKDQAKTFIGYCNCNDTVHSTCPGDNETCWIMSTNITNSISPGFSVAVSDDGRVVAVGEPSRDRVRIFESDGSQWTQLGYTLVGSITSQFGYSIQLSGDGTVMVVGAPEQKSPGGNSLFGLYGYLYIYKFSGNNWVETNSIENQNNAAYGKYGSDIQISQDGEIIFFSVMVSSAEFYGFNGTSYVKHGTFPLVDESGIALSRSGHIIAINDYINEKNVVIVTRYDGLNLFSILGSPIEGCCAFLSGDGRILAVTINTQFNSRTGNEASLSKIFHWEKGEDGGKWMQRGMHLNGSAIALSHDGLTVVTHDLDIETYFWNGYNWIDQNKIEGKIGDLSAFVTNDATGTNMVVVRPSDPTEEKNHGIFIYQLKKNTTDNYSQCKHNASFVRVEIIADSKPYETSWELRDVSTQILILRGDSYTLDDKYDAFVENASIPSNACYEFSIFDDGGNGICCSEGLGSYSLHVDGRLVKTGRQFKEYEQFQFGECKEFPDRYSMLRLHVRDNFPEKASIVVRNALSNTIMIRENNFQNRSKHYIEKYRVPSNECILIEIESSTTSSGTGSSYSLTFSENTIIADEVFASFPTSRSKMIGSCIWKDYRWELLPNHVVDWAVKIGVNQRNWDERIASALTSIQSITSFPTTMPTMVPTNRPSISGFPTSTVNPTRKPSKSSGVASDDAIFEEEQIVTNSQEIMLSQEEQQITAMLEKNTLEKLEAYHTPQIAAMVVYYDDDGVSAYEQLQWNYEAPTPTLEIQWDVLSETEKETVKLLGFTRQTWWDYDENKVPTLPPGVPTLEPTPPPGVPTPVPTPEPTFPPGVPTAGPTHFPGVPSLEPSLSFSPSHTPSCTKPTSEPYVSSSTPSAVVTPFFINASPTPSGTEPTNEPLSLTPTPTMVPTFSGRPSPMTLLPTLTSICVPEEIIVCDDFFVNDGSWVNMKVDTFGVYGSFLGRYGRGIMPPSKTFRIPEKTENIIITFVLYEIDQWREGDKAYIVINNDTFVDMGNILLHPITGNNVYSSYTNGISFSRTRKAEKKDIVNSESKNHIYDVKVMIPSLYLIDKSFMKIGFQFNFTEELDKESAGIDIFRVTALRSCEPCIPEEKIVCDDFFLNDGSWMNMKVDTFGSYGNFLGRYGRGVMPPSKTFTIPENTENVIITFLFYKIDHWNSSDKAYIIINKNTFVDMGSFSLDPTDMNKTYSSYIDGIVFLRTKNAKTVGIAFSERNDQIYNVKITIPNSYVANKSSMTIGFQFDLTKELSNESAGIDIFRVTAYRNCGLKSNSLWTVPPTESSSISKNPSSLLDFDRIINKEPTAIPDTFLADTLHPHSFASVNVALEPTTKPFFLPMPSVVQIETNNPFFHKCKEDSPLIFETFDVDNESWSNMHVETFGSYGNFLGRYSQNSAPTYKYFAVPKSAPYLDVEFLFYEIDEWEFDDAVVITIGRQNLDIGHFSVHETPQNNAYNYDIGGIFFSRDRLAPATKIAFADANDQIHKVKIRIPSPYYNDSGLLMIGFDVSMQQNISNEAAGFDQFKIMAPNSCDDISISPLESESEEPIVSPHICEKQNKVIDTDDFDSNNGSWSNMIVENYGPYGNILGPYGSIMKAPSKTFVVPFDTESLTIEFLFLEIGKWEEDDELYVIINDQIIKIGRLSFAEIPEKRIFNDEVNGIEISHTTQVASSSISDNLNELHQVHEVIMKIPPIYYQNLGTLTISFRLIMTNDVTNESGGFDKFKLTAQGICFGNRSPKAPTLISTQTVDPLLEKTELPSIAPDQDPSAISDILNTCVEKTSTTVTVRSGEATIFGTGINARAMNSLLSIEIISIGDDNIDFNLVQTLKADEVIDWIAAERFDPFSGKLICTKADKLNSSQILHYTAACTDGSAEVMLYVQGEHPYFNDESLIPTMCEPPEVKGKRSFLRFVLPCVGVTRSAQSSKIMPCERANNFKPYVSSNKTFETSVTTNHATSVSSPEPGILKSIEQSFAITPNTCRKNEITTVLKADGNIMLTDSEGGMKTIYDSLPIELLSIENDTVTFNVLQTWKREKPVSWIATERVDPDIADLVCTKVNQVHSFQSLQYSASCSNDIAEIRLYVHDDSFSSTDDPYIPAICSAFGDTEKTAFFQFDVPCKGSSSAAILYKEEPCFQSASTSSTSSTSTKPGDTAIVTPSYRDVCKQHISISRTTTMNRIERVQSDGASKKNYFSLPIEIVSLEKNILSFNVMQTWKEGNTIDWIATERLDPLLEKFVCTKVNDVHSTDKLKYSAACIENVALVTLYVHDSGFDISGNSYIPAMCDSSQVTSRKASFQFHVACEGKTNIESQEGNAPCEFSASRKCVEEVNFYGEASLIHSEGGLMTKYESSPIEIVAVDLDKVIFNVIQTWSPGESINWIATHRIDPISNKIICTKVNEVHSTETLQYTAACAGDFAQVELYVHASKFSTFDNSYVPTICDPLQEPGKKAFFQFKIPCSGTAITGSRETPCLNSEPACIDNDLIAFEDFEINDGSWSDMSISVFGQYGAFLGRYGLENEETYKLFSVPKHGSHITIEFLFYEIDKWEGCDEAYVQIQSLPLSMGCFSVEEISENNDFSTVNNRIQLTRTKLSDAHKIAFNDDYKDQIHKFLIKVPSSFYVSTGLLRIGFKFSPSSSISTISAGIGKLKITAHGLCDITNSPTSSPILRSRKLSRSSSPSD